MAKITAVDENVKVEDATVEETVTPVEDVVVEPEETIDSDFSVDNTEESYDEDVMPLPSGEEDATPVYNGDVAQQSSETIGKKWNEYTTGTDLDDTDELMILDTSAKAKCSISYMDTIRRYLSSFFAWCSDEGFIPRNPMRRIRHMKVPQKIKKPFSAAEREHLRCTATRERDIAIMEFLYSTAGRIGEVVALNRSDIDWGNREVIIYGEKGKKERKVYLTEECAYHLRKYLLSRTDTNPALFVGCRKPFGRLGKEAIQSMLSELGKKAHIHTHPHKFRRTLLTDAGNRGIPLQEIQAYAGHQKPDTTMMYVTVNEENVKASFRRYIA